MFNITLDQLFYLTAPNGSSTHVPEPEDSDPSAKSAILIPPYGGLYSAVVPTFPTEILAGSWTSAQAGATAYTCKQEEGGQSLTGERLSFPPSVHLPFFIVLLFFRSGHLPLPSLHHGPVLPAA